MREDPSLEIDHALALVELGDGRAALRHAEAALAAKPSADAFYAKACALELLGLESAQAYFRRAAAIDPSHRAASRVRRSWIERLKETFSRTA